MKPSRILGSREVYGETSGSESSWTRYIGSGIQQTYDNDYFYNDDDDGHYTGKQDHRKGNSGSAEEGESDDSMASDASSGPSHHELPSGSCNEGSLEMGGSSTFSKNTTAKKLSKEKQLRKQVKQKDGARGKFEREEELVLRQAKSSCSGNASSGVQRGVKVRKNN